MENGRGCVKIPWVEIEMAALASSPLRVFLDFIPASPDCVLPENEAALRKATARCDDMLRFWLDILIHAYDPETEYGVLIVQDGGPYRLYRVKPEAFTPKSATIKQPYGLN